MKILLFDNLLEIGINISIGIEIPQCQAAQLVIIVPIIEQLIDMLLTSLIFLCLGVIQIQCRDFTNHEGFHIGTVTFLGNLVRIVWASVATLRGWKSESWRCAG